MEAGDDPVRLVRIPDSLNRDFQGLMKQEEVTDLGDPDDGCDVLISFDLRANPMYQAAIGKPNRLSKREREYKLFPLNKVRPDHLDHAEYLLDEFVNGKEQPRKRPKQKPAPKVGMKIPLLGGRGYMYI